METLPELTVEQRTQIVTAVKDNPEIGNVTAIRAAGIEGTRGQLRALIDDDLGAELREARGYGDNAIRSEIKRRAFAGPDDPASGRLLLAAAKAYLPEYRDSSRVELTGRNGGPVELVAGRFDPDQLTTEELTELRSLLEKSRRELPAGEGT